MVLEDTGNIGESLCTSFWKYNMVNLGKWTKNAWFKKITYHSIIYEEIGFSKFFAFLRIFSSSLVKLSCCKLYKPWKLYKIYKPFTNFLLEGMESSVLQTFYKPTIFTNLTNFTNFLFEVSYRILSFTNLLQTLQTFYKLFPRRYRILCFTNFLQTLQTVQSLQTFCSKL